MALSKQAAFQGSILGLAAGDALGFPPEFHSRAQILASFGPPGIRDYVALHDSRWPGAARIDLKASFVGRVGFNRDRRCDTRTDAKTGDRAPCQRFLFGGLG